jgi:hypothetical protein
MRKLLMTCAAAAAFASAGLLTNSAGATVLSGPGGLRGAIEAGNVSEQIHCRPGRWHHRYRPHDGCFRAYQSYNYDPYVYGGPSIYFGGFGHRRHWGGRRW